MEKEFLDYQKRILIERDELKVKTVALQKYIESNEDSINSLDFNSAERRNLNQQLSIMQEYLSILEQRINRFYF